MKFRTALLSALFLFLSGAALAVPTAGDAPDSDDATLLVGWDLEPVAALDDHILWTEAPAQTAVYMPWPCDGSPFPGPGLPYPFPLPFPSPWPGPTDQCIPNPFPF